MKNYNIVLTEKQQKYQHYHQLKLLNMNILRAKKYYHLMIKQAKFTYFPLRKALKKQTKTIADKNPGSHL